MFFAGWGAGYRNCSCCDAIRLVIDNYPTLVLQEHEINDTAGAASAGLPF